MEVPANASPVLSDPFGRTVDYLRVSVTDRCDLRCSYCMPRRFRGFEQPEHWLTLDEITRVVAAFSRMGTRRVRLTGGEPLLRKGLPMLAAGIAALPGIDDLSLTTNGTQLGRQAMLLRSAGVQRLNVSLDSLRHDCVQHITGNDCLDHVLDGLRAAGMAEVPVVVGGIIPEADGQALMSQGVAAVFTPKDYDATAVMHRVVEEIRKAHALT